jgi:hypothetical protein
MAPSEDRAAVLVTLPAASLRLPAEPGGECGRVAVGMAHQGYDLQLTRRTRRAHDVLHDRDGTLAPSAPRTAWERTPWHAKQRAAWEALSRVND